MRYIINFDPPPAHDHCTPACHVAGTSLPEHRRQTVVAHRTYPGRCRACCDVIRNKDGGVSQRQWHPACWERYALRSGQMQYVRKFVWKRDHGVCAECGRTHHETSSGWQADHIVPLIDGGGFDLDNLQTLCTLPCHLNKTVAEAKARRQGRILEDAHKSPQLSIL